MTDEYLTKVVPEIRRAQSRACQALAFAVALIKSSRWSSYPEHILPYDLTFEKVNLKADNSGPSPPGTPASVSLSTASMCLHALRIIRDCRVTGKQFEAVSQQAADLHSRFSSEIRANCTNLQHTESDTYGDGDPLTAAWLLPEASGTNFYNRLKENIRLAAHRLLRDRDRYLVGPIKRNGDDDRARNSVDDHAWVILAGIDALSQLEEYVEDLFQWSITEVRQQLSFRVTRELGFDPAHLAAALAIALHLKEVPVPLVSAAVAALSESQQPDGSWLLERPFLGDERGRVNRPIAAELTLALVDLVNQLEARFKDDTDVALLQQALLGCLQHQREWLYLISVPPKNYPDGTKGPAWFSEYVRPAAGVFHTWATVRTSCALAKILDLESLFVTRRLLEESGFSRTRPDAIVLGYAESSRVTPKEDEIVDPELADPMLSKAPVAEAFRSVADQLREELANPKAKGGSAMLYGPPGTSKTTLAEATAKKLGWWLIQLSPSDFLIEGPNAVEYRAKRIFDYLTQMNNVVVLFDEIDHLVLDRSSEMYRSQENVFQFMTPSMLPKLKALRENHGIRFLIATNYGERVDPAISRKGRIDNPLLVPPPNYAARYFTLRGFTDQGRRGELAAATPLWSYSELRGLDKQATARDVEQNPPGIDLNDYLGRLGDKCDWRDAARLAREVYALAVLLAEVNLALGKYQPVLQLAWDKLNPEGKRLYCDLARSAGVNTAEPES